LLESLSKASYSHRRLSLGWSDLTMDRWSGGRERDRVPQFWIVRKVISRQSNQSA
jgi:hypothetical protein